MCNYVMDCYNTEIKMITEYIKCVIELMFGLSMFINAILFIPQAVKIYKTKNTSGLSCTTFAGFNVIQMFTIMHGYIRNDYVLVVGNALSLFTSGIITFLIFFCKNKRKPCNRSHIT